MEVFYKLEANLKDWWMPVLSGALLILVAFTMIFFPGISYAWLAVLFAWGLFAKGGFNLVFAIRSRHAFKGWVWFLMFGLLEMALGAYLLFQPGLAAAALLVYFAFWLTFTAISRLSFSLIMKDMGIKNWWWTLIGGFILLVLAFMIILNPVIGLFSAVYLVSFSLFLAGLLAISFGLELKKLNQLLLEM